MFRVICHPDKQAALALIEDIVKEEGLIADRRIVLSVYVDSFFGLACYFDRSQLFAIGDGQCYCLSGLGRHQAQSRQSSDDFMSTDGNGQFFLSTCALYQIALVVCYLLARGIEGQACQHMLLSLLRIQHGARTAESI